jgi:glycosyltransferase involved in cell wall biosynthesis
MDHRKLKIGNSPHLSREAVVPKVSVLLPVYQAATTLDETLESLLRQTIEDFEVVAVDDGSDDGSAEVLRAWAQRDRRFVAVDGPHLGLVGNLNRGLGYCRAPLIARMDADDIAHPQRLEKQVALLEARPDIAVVGCLVELFPPEQVARGFSIYAEWLNGLTEHSDIVRDIFVESPIVHPSAMMRRQDLEVLGGYRDKGWPEDYDLWLRYRSAGKLFAKVPETLLYWREHGARLTRTDGRYSVENFLRCKAHHLLEGPLEERENFFVWGAGQTGRRLSKHLIRGGRTPVAFVDIDPKKIGRTVRGVEVIDAEDLLAAWGCQQRPLLLAAVGSRGARALIRQRLAALGLVESADFICVA